MTVGDKLEFEGFQTLFFLQYECKLEAKKALPTKIFLY